MPHQRKTRTKYTDEEEPRHIRRTKHIRLEVAAEAARILATEGQGLGCGQPLSMALAFNAAPPGRSGEVVAMRMPVSYGAHVVTPPVFGVLGAMLGVAPVFWTWAVLMGGGAVLNRRQRGAAAK